MPEPVCEYEGRFELSGMDREEITEVVYVSDGAAGALDTNTKLQEANKERRTQGTGKLSLYVQWTAVYHHCSTSLL